METSPLTQDDLKLGLSRGQDFPICVWLLSELHAAGLQEEVTLKHGFLCSVLGSCHSAPPLHGWHS